MHEPDAQLPPLPLIAEAYFRGLGVEETASRTGLDLARVREDAEALEAVALLVAHDFPASLMARVVRLPPEKVEACRTEVRARLGAPEAARAFLAQRAGGAEEAPAAGAPLPGEAAHAAEDAPAPGEDAEEALAVLDFWASKWL
ncbi:MAG: hypothetical protein HY721_14955 [Planctomycetes bacterium]|nr:hypothetical protein [Planctomycetota bacterium]